MWLNLCPLEILSSVDFLDLIHILIAEVVWLLKII